MQFERNYINFMEDFQATYDAKSIILSINH